MREFTDRVAPHQLAFDAFGMQMRVCTNEPQLLRQIEALIPPGWKRRPRSSAQHRLGLLDEGDDWYSIYRDDGVCIHDAQGREYALLRLDDVIQTRVAQDAPDLICIHAGVVATGDCALLLPGRSFAGKTTLVRALVEAGAVYYSDEFAVLDATGRVHPYARPLECRPSPGTLSVTYRADELGGVAGEQPLPVRMVVATRYRPGGQWDPQPLSKGAGALTLLEHALSAEDRPDQTIRHITQAIAGATVLRSERGEADETANRLLDELRALALPAARSET